MELGYGDKGGNEISLGWDENWAFNIDGYWKRFFVVISLDSQNLLAESRNKESRLCLRPLNSSIAHGNSGPWWACSLASSNHISSPNLAACYFLLLYM